MENDNIPTPGSDAAIAMGCTCPVEDNHHGKGCTTGPDGEILFCYTAGCPVHDIKVVVCDESNIGHY